MESNNFSKVICKVYGGCFLDEKNILWKWVNDEWIGKRSVYTNDLKAKWIEEVEEKEIRSYWCGVNSNYKEIFKHEES